MEKRHDSEEPPRRTPKDWRERAGRENAAATRASELEELEGGWKTSLASREAGALY